MNRDVRVLALLFFVALLGIVLVGAAAAQDPKKTPKALPLGQALARGVAKAEHDLDAKVQRVTALPTDASGEATFVVFLEMPDGSIAFFQGGSTAADDQMVVTSKKELDVLVEVATRAARR